MVNGLSDKKLGNWRQSSKRGGWRSSEISMDYNPTCEDLTLNIKPPAPSPPLGIGLAGVGKVDNAVGVDKTAFPSGANCGG